jgi:hypothetical protein
MILILRLVFRFARSAGVSSMVKSITIVGLIIMNLLFVSFTLVHAMSRTLSWQRNYIIACVIQLVIETVIFEAIESFCVYYYIPKVSSIVMSHVVTELTFLSTDG